MTEITPGNGNVISPVSENASDAVTDIRTLMRRKIDALKTSRGEKNIRGIADAMGLHPSTLGRHMKSEFPFSSRTFASIVRELNITAAELKDVTNVQILGMEPEEREKILKAVEPIIVANPGQFDTEIFNELEGVCPQVAEHTPYALIPIFNEVRVRHGFEHPHSDLLKNIDTLGKRLGKMRALESQEMIRQFELGNMFEQMALLDYQVSENMFVPEYCLTAIRDKNGKVMHTKNIIDVLVQENEHEKAMQKTFLASKARIPGSDITLHEEGTLRLVSTGDKDEVWYWPTDDAKDSFKYLSFKRGSRLPDTEMAARFSIRGKDQYILSGIDPNQTEDHFLRSYDFLKEQKERWSQLLPLTGIEIKKAGTKRGIGRIVNQLIKQRDAILRHRERDPFSIPGMVHHINVVALNENDELREALDEVNKRDGEFFRYTIFTGIGGAMRKSADRIQKRTLPEVHVLKNFFRRVNDALSAEPTLVPLAQQKEDAMLSDLPDSNSKEDLLEYLRKSDERERVRNERQAALDQKHALTEQARSLMREFEFYLGSTVTRREEGESLEAALERDLAALFEKHFGTPYKGIAGGRTRLTVYEERDGSLVSFQRRFVMHNTGNVQGEDIIAKAKEIAARYSIELDVDNAEQLRELIEFLEEELDKKERKAAEKGDMERLFGVEAIDCHGDIYDELRDSRFCDRFRTYTPLEEGPIAIIKRKRSGAELDFAKALCEQMLITSRLADVRRFPDAERNKQLATWVNLPMGTLGRPESREGSTPLLHQAARLTPVLADMFSDMIAAIQGAREEDIGNILSTFEQRTRAIGFEHSNVLEQTYGEPAQDEMAYSSRPSIGIHVPKSMIDRIEENLSQKEFDPELIEQLSGIMHDEVGDNPTQLQAIAALFKMADSPEEEEAKKFQALLDSIGLHDGALTGELQKIVDRNAMSIEAACHTAVKGIEQRILYEFNLRMLERAVMLHHADPRLAADYAISSFESFIEYPDVYFDCYFDCYRAINDCIALERLQDIREFLAFSANGRDATQAKTEFLRGLTLCSLKEMPVAALGWEGLGKNTTAVFDAIREGGSCGDEDQKHAHWQRAKDILDGQEGTTEGVMKKLFSRERGDPHLRSFRRFSWIRRNELEQRSFGNMYNVGKEFRKFMGVAHDAIKLIDQDAVLRWEETKKNNDPVLRDKVHTLLVSFRSVAKARNSIQPGSEIGVSRMYNPEIYRGFPCHGQALDALRYIAEHASEIPLMYFVNTAEILQFAGYMDPDREEKNAEAKRQFRAEKKRKGGKPRFPLASA